MNKERVWNEENLPLAKWLIDKTNTKDYRIGNLLGMKHPKVDGENDTRFLKEFEAAN